MGNSRTLDTSMEEIRQKSALIIIDVQKDFSEEGGKAPVCREQADRMIEVINGLIGTFQGCGSDVLYVVNEWSNPITRFFTRNAAAKGTQGAALDSRLKQVGELIYSKSKPSAFTNPAFGEYLKSCGIEHLYISGLAAEYCVKATVLDALKKEYKVAVFSDAVAAQKCVKLKPSLEKYQTMGAKILSSAVLR